MAEVEYLLAEMLGCLSDAVDSSGIPIKELRQSLRTLAASSNLESLLNTSDPEVFWKQQLYLTGLDSNVEIAKFPTRNSKRPQPPLDGKTIKPLHILRIWLVLGLSSDPFPAADCELSLRRLASLRNDVAHRNISIEDVFRQPGTSASDIAGHLDHIQLLVLHLGHEINSYLADERFRMERVSGEGVV